MDKSTHGEHLLQPRQTNSKQFKIWVIFLIDYNGIFNVPDKNIEFYFLRSVNDDDFSVINLAGRDYQLESLNEEIERILSKKVTLQEKGIRLYSN